MGHTLDIQWKLQASLKGVVYPIFVGWFLKPVNISIEKLYLQKCRGIVLVLCISDHFVCLQGPLLKQTINPCLLWGARPPQSILWIKRDNIWVPPESKKMLFSDHFSADRLSHANHSICYSFPIYFSKVLGNCQLRAGTLDVSLSVLSITALSV